MVRAAGHGASRRGLEFDVLYSGRSSPDFVELVITGQAGVHDFGIDDTGGLVVSEAALAVVTATNPIDLTVVPLAW